MTEDFRELASGTSESCVLEHLDGPGLLATIDEVTSLYLAVHSDSPQGGSSLYARDAFLDRTTRQTQRDGFAAVTARVAANRELVGFAFGLTFAAGGWWAAHRRDDPPPEVLGALKFAVIELNVVSACRGQGLGRRLMDTLLAGRPEPYAILTTTPGSLARAMYARWGWEQVGTAQHTPEAPIMDQLVLPLAQTR